MVSGLTLREMTKRLRSTASARANSLSIASMTPASMGLMCASAVGGQLRRATKRFNGNGWRRSSIASHFQRMPPMTAQVVAAAVTAKLRRVQKVGTGGMKTLCEVFESKICRACSNASQRRFGSWERNSVTRLPESGGTLGDFRRGLTTAEKLPDAICGFSPVKTSCRTTPNAKMSVA